MSLSPSRNHCNFQRNLDCFQVFGVAVAVAADVAVVVVVVVAVVAVVVVVVAVIGNNNNNSSSNNTFCLWCQDLRCCSHIVLDGFLILLLVVLLLSKSRAC